MSGPSISEWTKYERLTYIQLKLFFNWLCGNFTHFENVIDDLSRMVKYVKPISEQCSISIPRENFAIPLKVLHRRSVLYDINSIIKDDVMI